MCALDGERVLDGQLAAGQERVARFFPPGRHPLPVPPRLVLAPLERLRVQLHRHRGRLAGQLVIPQPRRQAGQHLIGVGGVGVGQVLGGFPDEPGPVAVDEPGAEGGPGAGQPGLAGRGPCPSWSRAALEEVTSSMPSSASGNSPSRQPRGTFRAVASASCASRRRVNSATAVSSR